MTISQMSLKINVGWKQITKWVVIGIIGIVLLVFFIRVAIYEADYYSRMEGSERDVTTSSVISVADDVEEVEPTEQEVQEYTVAADRPRYLSIPKLGKYDVRVLPVTADSVGVLGTPRNIFDVGWYIESGKPGSGKTLVIDGHNGGPRVKGVFKNLPDLAVGDVIIIERGDGVKFTYSVVENQEVLLEEANRYMADKAMRSPTKGKESVTLITCSGEWSEQRGTYLSRQFVRAVLVG